MADSNGGGAKAPPRPLKSPMDGLLKKLEETGYLELVTETHRYRIDRAGVVRHGGYFYDVTFKVLKERFATWQHREWASTTPSRTQIEAVIAAICADGSVPKSVPAHGTIVTSLSRMVCGTGMYSMRPRR